MLNFPPHSELKRYDWGANLVASTATTPPPASSSGKSSVLPPVVMSAALGYSLKHFQNFIDSLREHYSGDVWLLISEDAGTSVGDGGSKKETEDNEDEVSEGSLIRSYLQEQNVHYLTSHWGKQDDAVNNGEVWEQINRGRFKFFSAVCDPAYYSLCLTTDFRDSIFQSNPFANIHRLLLPPPKEEDKDPPKGILHVFEHNKIMSPWHYGRMKHKKCNLYDIYGKKILEPHNIINGGSIIGSPYAYERIYKFMAYIWRGCNDQVILNLLVRSKILSEPRAARLKGIPSFKKFDRNSTAVYGYGDGIQTEVHPIDVQIHKQGYGPMNVLGHGGKIVRHGKNGKFLNRNCIVSPVVHQYDLVTCPSIKNMPIH